MSPGAPDPTVQGLRERISEIDRALVATVNARLELVAQLKQYKQEVGLPFVDPDRERELIDGLVGRNGGPLTDEGLRELYTYLLDLTKREVAEE